MKRPPHKSQPKKRPLRPAALAAWGALVLFAGLTAIALSNSVEPLPATPDAQPAQLAVAPANPAELTPADRGLYVMIDSAQTHHDYAAADQFIAQLANPRLVGYALAERYLDGAYKASNAELTDWLAHYRDHPQAARIAALAIRRGMNVEAPKAEQPLRGEGYADHQGKSAMPDSWFTALGHWRSGEYAEANAIFSKLSSDENLSDWQRAEAYFWSYRASEKLNEETAAQTALAHAAQYRTTFYGLIATATLGQRLPTPEAPEVSDSLRNDPRAIRAALLSQLSRNDDAEDELRALYSAAPKADRNGIVTLASELGLSNLQMRLARTPGLSDAEQLFAEFPAPQYMADLQPVMDSALVMAVARNESSFRELAHNPSGAMGVMQMLPATARALERRIGPQLLTADATTSNTPLAERLNDPAMSARYGAQYLKLLTEEPAIGHNLIHLLVGYNAGPGTVASWKAAARNVNDPLLYIESIPYAETRNYVMQVSAQYWVYQRMMDETPQSLLDLSKGQWPELRKHGA